MDTMLLAPNSLVINIAMQPFLFFSFSFFFPLFSPWQGERLRLGREAEGPENINQYVTLIYVLSVSVCARGLLVTLIPAQCPRKAGRRAAPREEEGN